MSTIYFAQKAFIVLDHKLLLVQKSTSDPYNPGRWEVPGGRMKFGEDVDAHIIREVREEVGLVIQPSSPFYIWQWTFKNSRADSLVADAQIVAVARLCKALTVEIDESGRVEGDFLGRTSWVPLEDVLSYDLIPNMLPCVRCFLDVVGVAHPEKEVRTPDETTA